MSESVHCAISGVVDEVTFVRYHGSVFLDLLI